MQGETQPPILEAAICDCLDYFNMSGISQGTRLKLIRQVLEDTWKQHERFKFENRMAPIKGWPVRPVFKYENGQSQIFFACYYLVIKGGNPGQALQGLRNIIDSNPYFLNYQLSKDDFVSSRRGTKARPIDISDIDGPASPDGDPYKPA